MLKILANRWTTASRSSFDVMFEVSRVRVPSVMALVKFFSSSLSLLMDQKKLSMLVSLILSQTSFGHISINSSSILTVSMATESP